MLAGVEGTFCESMHPDWLVCGSDDPAPLVASSAVVTVPLRNTPISTSSRRPTSTSRPKKNDDGDKDEFDDTFDDDRDLFGSGSDSRSGRRPSRPHKPRPPPSRPSVVSKLDELRLSPKWDIHAKPQKREYWFTIDERRGSPDGCASSSLSLFFFLVLSSSP